MYKIILADNTELDMVTLAEQGTRRVEGAERNVLTLRFPIAYTASNLSTLFKSQAKTATINLPLDGDNLYENYTLWVSTGAVNEDLNRDPALPPQMEERMIVELAQKVWYELPQGG